MIFHKPLMCVLSTVLLLPGVSQAAQPVRSQDPARRVDVGLVESVTLKEQIPLVGSLEPWRSAMLMSRVDGVLTELTVDIGDKVEAGQVLARVSAPVVEAQMGVFEAAMVRAETRLSEARAKLPVAEAALAVVKAELIAHSFALELASVNAGLELVNVRRVRALEERGSATQVELERAEAGHERALAKRRQVSAQTAVMEAHVAGAQAQISATEVQVALADVLRSAAQHDHLVHGARLDLAILRAPFAGVVTNRYLDSGALIGMHASPILQLMQTDILRLALLVPETVVGQVRVGNRVRARFDAFPGRVLEGQVARTAGALDPSSRTLRVELPIDNSTGELLPGMYVRASLTLKSRPDAAVIPGDALWAAPDGSTYVMVLDGGHARRREVEVGMDDGIRVEIRAGLKAGETVILGRPTGLTDGDSVTPVKQRGEGR